ncbi:alcohol dehydrogenase catalytic domain-containing protein [Sphingomonas naphthae]|uniref:Alcohol dehydrogenase catalytic domain-containing protein n=1 Tax=Sphingomonas naphthae TaxID=1813468 RepID=A0ABY7TG44_9SPHN|nr:alcohol dehydrogenase catalytic domain-containing protein [Sphingomonas naphthae]WCT72198.1 alcohol dehydrogenase catalytic domain-containing protein [Sphingomonas naphthae]
MMRAIGHHAPRAIGDEAYVAAFDLPRPEATGHDLLVKVHAVSVNPVDLAQYRRGADAAGPPMVLGYDVAGEVVAVGEAASLFKPGDAIFYAGSPTRPGGNAEYQLVDERLAGPKPATLSFANAATVPLAYLTAYEALGDALDAWDGPAGTLLVAGGSGRVAIAAIQIAKALSPHDVIAAAGDARSQQMVRDAGADAVVSYAGKIADQLKAQGLSRPERILSMLTDATSWPGLVGALAPYGAICAIDRGGSIELAPLVAKGGRLVTEGVFNRGLYRRDMIRQHRALGHIGQLIDDRRLQPPPPDMIWPLDADHLTKAHAAMAKRSGPVRIVLTC